MRPVAVPVVPFLPGRAGSPLRAAERSTLPQLKRRDEQKRRTGWNRSLPALSSTGNDHFPAVPVVPFLLGRAGSPLHAAER